MAKCKRHGTTGCRFLLRGKRCRLVCRQCKRAKRYISLLCWSRWSWSLPAPHGATKAPLSRPSNTTRTAASSTTWVIGTKRSASTRPPMSCGLTPASSTTWRRPTDARVTPSGPWISTETIWSRPPRARCEWRSRSESRACRSRSTKRTLPSRPCPRWSRQPPHLGRRPARRSAQFRQRRQRYLRRRPAQNRRQRPRLRPPRSPRRPSRWPRLLRRPLRLQACRLWPIRYRPRSRDASFA